MNNNQNNKKKFTIFERIASATIWFTGSTAAFIVASLIIILWLVTGPVFNYSDTWQLFINTSTTIITFLMVFIIQHAQNKDSKAVHIKLNELIASLKGPNNRVVDIEDFTEEEIDTVHRYYQRIAERTQKEKNSRAPITSNKKSARNNKPKPRHDNNKRKSRSNNTQTF